MRKLIAIFRVWDGQRELRIFESPNKLRGEVRCFKDNKHLMAADFFVKDNDATEYRVKEYFGFNKAYKVPFERKNGKIILYPINKQKRIIWSNQDYEEWCEAMKGEITEEEITPEYYGYCRENELGDERINLNIEVDGVILAFAKLGLWNGTREGIKTIGSNVRDILYSDCDYITWYCDPYNVRCDAVHHDGTNHYIYRVAETNGIAERIRNKMRYGKMDEETFRRMTKPLRPYVAKVYGW